VVLGSQFVVMCHPVALVMSEIEVGGPHYVYVGRSCQ